MITIDDLLYGVPGIEYRGLLPINRDRPPTPDTTPVPALRTPAGIGLKPDVVTPTPAAK
jgi:hypothetical protein